MQKQLNQLPAGTRFTVPEIGVEATLVAVNECRARVRIDRGERIVGFTNPDGTWREFVAHDVRTLSWSPVVVVNVLYVPEAV